MKNWTKAGVILSATTMILSGCSGIQKANFVGKAQAGTPATQTSTTPSSTNVSQDNIEYAFTQAGQHPEKLLVKEIDAAKSTLDIAIYSITQPDIVRSILKAEERGVKVRIITDHQEAQNKYQKEVLGKFIEAKIPVKENTHSGLMHLKVSIIDNKTVTTGSFNYTSAASKTNDEVLVILHDDSKMAQDFEQQFNRMWDDTQDFSNL